MGKKKGARQGASPSSLFHLARPFPACKAFVSKG
jgi:hypothetical protein